MSLHCLRSLAVAACAQVGEDERAWMMRLALIRDVVSDPAGAVKRSEILLKSSNVFGSCMFQAGSHCQKSLMEEELDEYT